MRAAIMRDKALVIDTVPDPEPGMGEVLVKTLACGICGSDLHALEHADKLVEAARESGAPFMMDPSRDIVMGHEFCAEVVDFGPGTQRTLKPGDRVVSMPIVIGPSGFEGVGYSNTYPGGYGELMKLQEMLILPVPNGLSTDRAALTEPMAVGVHAVNKGRIQRGDAGIVVGCGPVGLAVIAALRRLQIEPIIAADFSPRRRALATAMGAHTVVDPATQSAVAAHRETAGGYPAVVFECVGVPGMLDRLMRDALPQTRIVVVGVCMEDDHIRPILGINKELAMQFVLGYQPDEFADTLRAIAEGELATEGLVTGRVALDGIPRAFQDLKNPEAHAKLLVEPWR